MGHEVIAYQQEPGYAQKPTQTGYSTPGADVTLSEISIDNGAERIRVPGQADPYATVFHQFEGSISVSGTITTGNTSWFQNVMADNSSPYEFQIGSATSSRWYVGCDPGVGTVERELMGVVFPQCSISCEQDDEVTFELTGFYGDEQKNSSLSKGSPIQPTGDPLVFHGGKFELPKSQKLMGMESGTLTLNSQARLHRGWDRHPFDAVMGGHESQVEFERVFFQDGSVTDIAYGSQGSTAPQKYPSGASGVLSFTAPSGTLTATLNKVVPSEYSWDNAGQVNEDMMETGTFFVNSPSIATA